MTGAQRSSNSPGCPVGHSARGCSPACVRPSQANRRLRRRYLTDVELLFRTDQALKAAGQSALAAHERVRGSGLWPSVGTYHR